MKSESDIAELLSKGKSHEAMNCIMLQFKRFVHSIAIRYMRDDEDAKDITQEAFIKAYQSLNTFRGESHIRTWLYAITRNLCLNAIEKKKRQGHLTRIDTYEQFDLPADEQTDSIVIKSEFSAFLRTACQSYLKNKEKHLFFGMWKNYLMKKYLKC